jgi:hypothetical protein
MRAALSTRSSVVFVGLAQAQAEAHVLAHRHVRVQRVALEHHRDVAVLGLQVVDDLAVDQDLAAADLLQPGQHAQQRALAAARGPTSTTNSPSAMSKLMPWMTLTLP